MRVRPFDSSSLFVSGQKRKSCENGSQFPCEYRRPQSFASLPNDRTHFHPLVVTGAVEWRASKSRRASPQQDYSGLQKYSGVLNCGASMRPRLLDHRPCCASSDGLFSSVPGDYSTFVQISKGENSDLIDMGGTPLYTAPAADLLHVDHHRLDACTPSEAVLAYTFCVFVRGNPRCVSLCYFMKSST